MLYKIGHRLAQQSNMCEMLPSTTCVVAYFGFLPYTQRLATGENTASSPSTKELHGCSRHQRYVLQMLK